MTMSDTPPVTPPDSPPDVPSPAKGNVQPRGTRPRRSSGSHRYYNAVVSHTTSTQANRTILIAVTAGVAVVLVARISGTPDVKQLNDPGDLIKIGVGYGATVIALMIVAEATPEVASGFALLIAVGALLAYGVPFARALSKGTLNPGVPTKTIGEPAKAIGKVDV